MDLGLMELEMVTDAQVRSLRKLMKETKRTVARAAAMAAMSERSASTSGEAFTDPPRR